MTTSTETETEAAPEALATYINPTARVDLMPPEILATRRLRAVQRRLVLLVVLVLVAVAAATMWFRMDRATAADALQTEVAVAETLRGGLEQFAELPQIQSDSATIDTTLGRLMVDDVAWESRLQALNTPALADIRFTTLTMSVADVAGALVVDDVDGTPGTLDASGVEHIGVLTVTGQASSHDVVAAWVASLADVQGFRVPYILGSRVSTEGGSAIEFTVEITLDSTARTQRYAVAPAVEGASSTATTIDEGN